MAKQKLLSTLLIFSIALLACTSVSRFFGDPDPNDPGIDPKELEDDSISGYATSRAENRMISLTETPEPGLPTATPTEVTLDNPLNLTPQELTASGLHTYKVTSYSSEGTFIETSTDQREFVFTATGVEFHYPGLGYVSTYTKLEPNIYVTESGWSTVTFTDSGITYVEQNGAKNIWTRTD